MLKKVLDAVSGIIGGVIGTLAVLVTWLFNTLLPGVGTQFLASFVSVAAKVTEARSISLKKKGDLEAAEVEALAREFRIQADALYTRAQIEFWERRG